MFSIMKSMALAAVVAASGLLLATSSSKAETNKYFCDNYSQVLSQRVQPSLCDPDRERADFSIPEPQKTMIVGHGRHHEKVTMANIG